MKQISDKTIEKLRTHLIGNEGDVYLTDAEEALLKKIEMAHHLFQSRQYTVWEMTRFIARCFSCSDGAARMAMTAAQTLFGSKSIYNRSYMAALHLDEIIADMIAARERGDWSMVLDLHKIKNKAIEILPTEAAASDITPAAIHFHVHSKSAAEPIMSKKDAIAAALELVHQKPMVIPIPSNDREKL